MLSISTPAFTAENKNMIELGKIEFEQSRIINEESLTRNNLPKDISNQISSLTGLSEGTVLVRFNTDSTAIQSLFSVSNGTAGYPNTHFHLYCAAGKVGFEIRQQSGGDYEKKSVNAEINMNQDNYLAFTASAQEGYKLILNGKKILSIPVNEISSSLGYGFFKNLIGLNSSYIGKTKRVMSTGISANEYPFSGEIQSLEIYSTALPEDILIQETGVIDTADREPIRMFNLFNKSDWNSPAFRIPSLLTLQNGTVLAVCDIRYGDSNDSPNNIDTGIRRSIDGGMTWSEPELILNFLDYPNVATSQITNSASYIDPVMIQNKEGRVYLFVDAMPGGIGQANAIAHTGFGIVGDEDRLLLQSESNTNWSLGSDHKVYDENNVVTKYMVGDGFELYENGNKISNIFYKNSPVKLLNTTYIVMCYSDDNGVSWSSPEIMNIKTDDMKFFGVAPGVGITLKNGKYAGRMVVPMYYTSSKHTTEWACLIYSDDNGATWERGESPNDGRVGGEGKLHESQVVEMPDGQLKMFSRSLSHASVSTSFDGGETWDDEVSTDTTLVMSSSSGCQLSIINYSQTINGKPAVIFSNPAAYTRSQGTVRVGLIQENGVYESVDPIKNGKIRYDISWISSKLIRNGEFAYSCLTELPNHNIGILYEENNTRFTLDHLVYAEYNLRYLMGDVL